MDYNYISVQVLQVCQTHKRQLYPTSHIAVKHHQSKVYIILQVILYIMTDFHINLTHLITIHRVMYVLYMLRVKQDIRALCTMSKYFGQCNNHHFNTQFVHTLTGHCSRFPGQCAPCPDSSGTDLSLAGVYSIFSNNYYHDSDIFS